MPASSRIGGEPASTPSSSANEPGIPAPAMPPAPTSTEAEARRVAHHQVEPDDEREDRPGVLIGHISSLAAPGDDEARLTSRRPSGLVQRLTVLVVGLLAAAVPAQAGDPVYDEWSGFVSAEARLFPDDPLFPEQQEQNVSIAAEPEYYAEWDDRSAIVFSPYFRVDSADPERTRADLREFLYTYPGRDFDVAAGVGRVFWGVTESQHLVDIINQTDLIENIDEEDKLGQPMLSLALLRDWGTLSFYYLPFFRERTFPGREGRLRTAIPVDTDRPRFESDLEQWHPDFAVRYADSRGPWDFGLYHFYGTSREPALLPARVDGGVVLVPRYDLIHQTALDLQFTTGPWLWKLEALYRRGQRNTRGVEEDYGAWIGGFEYTFFGIGETNIDVGALAEWSFDTRGDTATTAFDNDLFLGTRIGLNDVQGTQILAGVVQDVESDARLVAVEASRRIGASFRLFVELRAFLGIPSDDLLASIRRDDHLRIELAYFY